MSLKFFTISNISITTRALTVLLLLYTILVTAWIGDDAQITFRQIWNFISGDGITFNHSERVQAFSHPLWFWVLSLISSLTRELFLTTIIVSIVLAILAISIILKIEINLYEKKLTLLTPVILLLFSWSFIDYSTSGLENSLSFLLVGLLLFILFCKDRRSNLKIIFLILSLLVLNRFDHSVLFLPLAIFLMLYAKDLKNLIQVIWPGTLLIAIWLVFSTIYFGSPLPNPFYAKLQTNFPANEVFERGIEYFLVMKHDLNTIFLIIFGIILSILSRNTTLIALSLGQILYMCYILYIGGDFMFGRFFAILVFLSIGQIIIAVHYLKFKIFIKNVMIVGVLLISLLIGLVNSFPFTSTTEYKERTDSTDNTGLGFHIRDQRGIFYWAYGLFSSQRINWPTISAQSANGPKVYKATCGILGGLSIKDTTVHHIDACGLTDPLIARLPAVQNENWRIGHHFRKLPQNYGELKLNQVNELSDSSLTKFAKDTIMLSTGDIFSKKRMLAIWRVNSKHYSKLNLNKYLEPDIYIPVSTFTERVEINDWNQKIEYDQLPPIYGTHKFRKFNGDIQFISHNPQLASEVEFDLEIGFTYEIFVNGLKMKHIEKSLKQEDYNVILRLPQKIYVNSIRIQAIDAISGRNTSKNILFGFKVKS